MDTMNKLITHRKANSMSTFDFSTLDTKLQYNKLLIVLNNLINFCFDEGENKYITVCSYGVHWVKDIKYNQIGLNKLHIKDAVAYLLFNCYFTVGPKIFWHIIGFHVDPIVNFLWKQWKE